MLVMEGERYVSLTGKEPGRAKAKFLMVTPDQVNRFLSCCDPASSRDLLVWMLLLNAGRVLKASEFEFRPRWRKGIDLPSRIASRALDRLERAGMIEVTRRRGRSPLVTLRSVTTGEDS